ncbi:MAG: hypothetical protein KF736_08390 [Acidobacteria bacterium]|nr:hypothetical protein [Acidobacteriota bacterium]MCW5950069.1 hypothetical protein [Pyrinomonadaceae bacterium]
MIAIASDELNLKGSSDVGDETVDWIGYEPFLPGYWSLLCEGLFSVPLHALKLDFMLNEYGMFSTPSEARNYSRFYFEQSIKGTFEELPTSIDNVIIVRVGRPRTIPVFSGARIEVVK